MPAQGQGRNPGWQGAEYEFIFQPMVPDWNKIESG